MKAKSVFKKPVEIAALRDDVAQSRQCGQCAGQSRLLKTLSVLVLCWLSLIGSGCVYGPDGPRGARGGDDYRRVVAVMGAIGNSGSGQSQRINSLLEKQLFESGKLEHVPYRFVRQSLGQEFHQTLITEYSNYGDLSGSSLERLAEARLPAQYAMFIKLEHNETSKSEPTLLPVRNRYGDVLNDRMQVTLSHRRHVVVSATVYNIYTGDLAWQRAFESIPEATNSYVEYSGSSFAGSVAAQVANSFVNGRRVDRHPPAPNENTAIREAVREIVHNLLTGPRRL